MRCILLSVFLIFSTIIFAGGPWLNKKKGGFFQIQSTFPGGGYSNLFLSNNTDLQLNRTVLDYNFTAYLEYGLTDKLNIVSTIPYKFISTGDTLESITNINLLQKGSLSGLSNTKIALKYRLSDKKIKAAISLKTNLKTISKEVSKGLVTGYDANSIGLYIHVGKSFSSKLYSFLDVGINTVSNNFSDYYEVHYELGYQIKPSLWTAFTLDLRESLQNGNYQNDNLRQTGFYTNNQEYFAYGIKTSYELKNKIGFTFATFGAFSGNYVAKISTFSIGIYKKW